MKAEWWVTEGEDKGYLVWHRTMGVIAVFVFRVRAHAFAKLMNENPALSKLIKDLA